MSLEFSEYDSFSPSESLIDDTNDKLEPSVKWVLTLIFSFVIFFGALGNLIVVWTILFKKHMRIACNMFTLNLAISDLILCILSIPLMMYKSLNHMWNFGDLMCRLSNFSQATNVICSSLTIAAIALDRYISIFTMSSQRREENLRMRRRIFLIIIIWLFSVLLGLPLFIFSEVKNHSQNLTSDFSYDINHCVENWLQKPHQLIYSILTHIIQFLLPNLIVAAANVKFGMKLRRHKKHMKTYTKNIQNDGPDENNEHSSFRRSINYDRPRTEDNRQKKLNFFLIYIAVLFAVSWLPLNVFNLLSDSNFLTANETYYFLNTICILFAMSSAVFNPVLYGFFNENFKREYKVLLEKIQAKFLNCI